MDALTIELYLSIFVIVATVVIMDHSEDNAESAAEFQKYS